MNFGELRDLVREKFAEPQGLLNIMPVDRPLGGVPLSDNDKAMRGLWLVSLYAAFEKSINMTVETAIFEISSHQTPGNQCLTVLHGIFNFSKIQSLKTCAAKNVIDKSFDLFSAVDDSVPMVLLDNPLADMLQNVDANTLKDVSKFFGAGDFEIEASNLGRINNLRERRNAVSHGRDFAKEVGTRLRFDEMNRLYQIVSSETDRFCQHMESFCVGRSYIKGAA